MTTCRQRGFTLIEVIVVLAVLGIVLGTAVPLAGAVVQADRRQEARSELDDIAAALHAYWFDNAAFPSTLNAPGFVGVYLQPGPEDTAIADAFANQSYQYSVNLATQVATIYSVGENGIDDGAGSEELVAEVFAAVPGHRRTWQRMRFIIEVLANYIESGGSTSGTWTDVRTRIGLGASFEADGWGTTLQWVDTTFTLSSAGPDRVYGNADDIIF